MLDTCLFKPDVRAGTIAHTLTAAEAIFREKVKFPYENLEDGLSQSNPAVTDSARTLRFANNSMLRVETSLRSGIYQFLHVSELGHICARTPDKAREIRTTPVQGYTGAIQAIMHIDVTERLKSTNAPTLIIVGEDDESTPLSAAKAVHGAIADSDLVVIPSAKHFVNADQSEILTMP